MNNKCKGYSELSSCESKCVIISAVSSHHHSTFVKEESRKKFKFLEIFRMLNKMEPKRLSGVAALKAWCQWSVGKYPGVRINNMSSDWRDGLAFCALIHCYRPHLLDFGKLDRSNWTG